MHYDFSYEEEKSMVKKDLVIGIALGVALSCGGVIFAQSPVVNISSRHGNLRAAQSYIVEAFQKINAAQRDNQDQLGGHAQKAKDFLVQADQELRLAADVSNSEGR
jgi:hypothetical protein